MANELPPNMSSRNKTSSENQRPWKSLKDKMKDLGIEVKKKEMQPSKWFNLQYIDVKTEKNQPLNAILVLPNTHLETVMYYQPEPVSDSSSAESNMYRIEKFETKSLGPSEITRISDIEVKSYKPKKKIKFRKRKKRSSVIAKVEEILGRGKESVLHKFSSEESLEVKEPQQQKNISCLSEALLQKIFFFLSQKERNLIASRVCKSWYYILKDPMFWSELSFEGNKVSSETIIKLIKLYPSLKKLKLTSVDNCVKILQELCRCNQSITNLGVRHCEVLSSEFARIIVHTINCCVNLEVLDVKGMLFHSERFYLELGRLKNLKSLNLNGNKLLKKQDLVTLAINCRNLRELKILDTIVNDEIELKLKDDDINFITSHLQNNLETLKMDMKNLGNISYLAILRCSRLKCLALKNCLLLSRDVFHLFGYLTELKKLKITRAINLKPEDFREVFESLNLRKIEDLDINGCWGVGEIGLEAITKTLTSLKYLSLKNCKSVKGENLTFLSRCPDLTHLNIAHTNVNTNHLLLLPKHVKNLKYLVIDSNIFKKSIIWQLKEFFPFLNVTLSYSEYQKDERPLLD